jgi:protein-disulfide isomerase
MWRRFLSVGVLAGCVLAGVSGVLAAQTSAPAAGAATAAGSVDQAQLAKSTEAFVRDLYAWGPDYTVKIGPFSDSPAPGYYRVTLQVTFNGQSDSGELYVSKDGKSVLRGDVFAMDKDPYSGVRDHLHIEGNPSMGPEDAPVTLVEFADFECPHCKEFNDDFPTIQQKFPGQIRLVYKDLPLSDIHPWAQTGAVGARCAFMQSPAAFWRMHDAIFKNQDSITPDTVWDQLNSYAKDEGLDGDAFKACLSAPDAAKAVDANRADAVTLGVSSTPTIYVNGRPVVGGDPGIVEQYIQFELNSRSKK